MGLFGGLIKDSPATFWINAGRHAKGRVAKSRSKRRQRAYARTSEDVYEYEPRHHTAKRYGHYALLGAILMPLAGHYVGALVLVGLACAFYGLERLLKKRVDKMLEQSRVEGERS